MIEYQEYTKLNNYNKQDKILSKLAVRYPNRFSDSLPKKKTVQMRETAWSVQKTSIFLSGLIRNRSDV